MKSAITERKMDAYLALLTIVDIHVRDFLEKSPNALRYAEMALGLQMKSVIMVES